MAVDERKMSEEKSRESKDATDPLPPPLPGGKKRTLAGEQAVVVVQQPSIWRGVLSWLGWMVAGLCLLAIVGFVGARQEYFDSSGGIREKYHSLSKESKAAQQKIALLHVSGVITSGDGFVKRQIDRIREDEHVKGIVIRIESPGGSVYGSDFILHHLKELRAEKNEPMVVSMGSLAASGGYYVAMAVGDQEKCIFAEPLTTTGSIGVIIPHYNISGLMEEHGMVDDSLATHPRKTMLSMTRPMTDDDRQVLEQYMDHAFERFKEVIKEGRPQFREDPESLDALATGEMFTAEQAKQLSLVDEIGFVEDAIARVLEMAGLDAKETRVITYTRPVSMLDAISLTKPAKPFDQSAIHSLLKFNTQQAFYLTSPAANWLAAERD